MALVLWDKMTFGKNFHPCDLVSKVTFFFYEIDKYTSKEDGGDTSVFSENTAILLKLLSK